MNVRTCGVPALQAHDVRDRTISDHRAVEQDRAGERVSPRVDLMGSAQHGSTPLTGCGESAGEQISALTVEAGERLVEEQDVGILS
jgi:hypothetical protein